MAMLEFSIAIEPDKGRKFSFKNEALPFTIKDVFKNLGPSFLFFLSSVLNIVESELMKEISSMSASRFPKRLSLSSTLFGYKVADAFPPSVFCHCSVGEKLINNLLSYFPATEFDTAGKTPNSVI